MRTRLLLCLFLLPLVSGCGMALRLADSASTSSAIKNAGTTLRVGDETIELSARIERDRATDGSGLMSLKLTSSGNSWPLGVRVSLVGFRPQSGGHYFLYINWNEQGQVTRITSSNAGFPKIETIEKGLEIQFRIQRLVTDKQYEAVVNLRDNREQSFSLGIRDIEPH